ncbi:15614_t:CDS:2 [Funneliformis geosporum]|nr:15614_t:CDS:2 [Funneliformis geosporum]
MTKLLTLKEKQHQYYLKNKEKYLTRAKKQAEKLREKREKKCKKELEIIEQEERPTFLRPLLARCIREYGERELSTDVIDSFLKENLTKYEPASLKVFRNALSSYSKFQKGDKRNNLILDLLFYTGIRVNELINLRHCDYQNESLKIKGKGNKIRYIPIPVFLAKHFNGGTDYLFKTRTGKRIEKIQIRIMIYKKTKKAGINKHISPHTFRRSFATILNKKEVRLTIIQKVLGHNDIQTTSSYIHNSREEIYNELNKENVEYSPYGSKLKKENFAKDVTEEQQEIKNSPKFYQQAPFLTIAEDLLKLIKEDKGLKHEKRLLIDDNPNICKSVFANNYDKVKISKEYPNEYFAVIAPYYPATENQHHKEVLLVKNEEQPSVNFWENCGQKTKTEIMDLLAEKLGKPKNNLDINCLDALARKILYFYGEVKDNRSQAIHSLTGQVVEIAQTTFKEGKRGGEIYYSLKLANKTILRAIKADLSIEK